MSRKRTWKGIVTSTGWTRVRDTVRHNHLVLHISVPDHDRAIEVLVPAAEAASLARWIDERIGENPTPQDEIEAERLTAERGFLITAQQVADDRREGLLRTALKPAVHRGESMKRCEEFARKGTGHGACDRPLDDQGYCDRASDHVESEEKGESSGT